MRKYETAEIEVIDLELSDIITTSMTMPVDNGGGGRDVGGAR